MSKQKKQTNTIKAYQIQVTVEGIEPVIMRSLVLPAGLTFRQLHLILQAAFEWQDYHLYEFQLNIENEDLILTENPDEYDFESESRRLDSKEIYVDDFFDRIRTLTYCYDFGDNWIHQIEIQSFLPDYPYRFPRVSGFSGNMIPEDSGGPSGYLHLISVLDDPENEEYATLSRWAEMQGLHPFQLKKVNHQLQMLFPWFATPHDPEDRDWQLPFSLIQIADPEVGQVLQQLLWSLDASVLPALEKARTMPHKLTDYFLTCLYDAADHLELLPDHYTLPIYALYLLSEWREPKAFSAILKLSVQDPEALHHFFADELCELWPSALLSTYSGDLDSLLTLAELPQIHAQVKAAVSSVLAALYQQSLLSRQELITYYQWLLHQPAYTGDFADLVAYDCCALRLKELLPLVREMLQYGEISSDMFGEYDEYIDWFYDLRHPAEVEAHIITDTTSEFSWLRRQPEPSESLIQKQRNQAAAQAELERNTFYQLHPKGTTIPLPATDEEILAQDEPERWLKNYPEHSVLSQYYDEESIQIDTWLYLALHERFLPEWELDYETPEYSSMRRNAYLKKAYALFQDKCQRENIPNGRAYDKKYMIHYGWEDWLGEAKRLSL